MDLPEQCHDYSTASDSRCFPAQWTLQRMHWRCRGWAPSTAHRQAHVLCIHGCQSNSSCYCQYEPFNVQPTKKHCKRLNFVGIHAMTKKLDGKIHPNGQYSKCKLWGGGTEFTLSGSYIQVWAPSPWPWAFFYHCNNLSWGNALP